MAFFLSHNFFFIQCISRWNHGAYAISIHFIIFRSPDFLLGFFFKNKLLCSVICSSDKVFVYAHTLAQELYLIMSVWWWINVCLFVQAHSSVWASHLINSMWFPHWKVFLVSGEGCVDSNNHQVIYWTFLTVGLSLTWTFHGHHQNAF